MAILHGFLFVVPPRYPNLDFGWKRSIDSKSFISCIDSCTEDAEDDCQHQETVAPDPNTHWSCSYGASLSSEREPQQPLADPQHGDAACTGNLTNGTALVTNPDDDDDDGHQEEHLHQCDNCQRSQPGSSQLGSPESIQTTTSVPMQPSPSSKNPGSAPGELRPQPGDECTPGRTSDRVNKPTSACSPAATGPDVPIAPSPDPAESPQPDTAVEGDSPKSLGPNPGLILQALTLSNASDGFNLERLEMLGDSFLKHAITTYLFCTYPDAHEGRLSYMRSKKVRWLQTDS